MLNSETLFTAAALRASGTGFKRLIGFYLLAPPWSFSAMWASLTGLQVCLVISRFFFLNWQFDFNSHFAYWVKKKSTVRAEEEEISIRSIFLPVFISVLCTVTALKQEPLWYISLGCLISFLLWFLIALKAKVSPIRLFFSCSCPNRAELSHVPVNLTLLVT